MGFKTWLDAQSSFFRDGIEVVAVDGSTGFKTAAGKAVPDVVMDVPRRGLAGDSSADVPSTFSNSPAGTTTILVTDRGERRPPRTPARLSTELARLRNSS